MDKMIQAAVLLHTDGGGQKVVGAQVEADTAWTAGEAAAENFEVEGKRITGTKLSAEAVGADILRIDLDANGPDAGTRDMSNVGPDAKATFVEPKLTVMYRPTGETITTSLEKDDLADRFKTGTYYDEETGIGLNYNLFVPNEYEGTKAYPLVVFLHDAGTCSYDVRSALLQGNGAVSWASPEEQEKHPCFVLAPQFPEVIANDDFKVTQEADEVIGLIRHIAGKYRIDTGRIYGTGQSMGTMTLCELMLRNPGFFAACFLCAGQWNPERMAAAKDEHLWILISEKDEKAWPIMGACVRKMEEAGAKVARGGWSATDPIEAQEKAAQKIAQQDADIYFTWFTGDSVKPPYMPEFPGVYHICTWQHTYQIQTIKDWVFRQRKE